MLVPLKVLLGMSSSTRNIPYSFISRHNWHKYYDQYRSCPDLATAKEEAKRPEALNKPASVLIADTLPPLAISIKWLKTSKFLNKEELDEVLDQADLADIPNKRQTIRQDPRLTSSIESFKDHIRRLYNCQKLHININSLKLTYNTVDNLTSGETEEQSRNILTQS